METVEKLTYQNVAPWMIWVALLAGIALCVAVEAVWKVVQINRNEKKRKQDEIQSIAEAVIGQRVETLADDISQKVMESMQDKFDAIDRKLDSDKVRIENAEKRSAEHDKALDRIETTLDSVDANIKDMRTGFTCLARGTLASLNHQRHNGNAEELDRAISGMNEYLTARPIAPMN